MKKIFNYLINNRLLKFVFLIIFFHISCNKSYDGNPSEEQYNEWITLVKEKGDNNAYVRLSLYLENTSEYELKFAYSLLMAKKYKNEHGYSGIYDSYVAMLQENNSSIDSLNKYERDFILNFLIEGNKLKNNPNQYINICYYKLEELEQQGKYIKKDKKGNFLIKN